MKNLSLCLFIMNFLVSCGQQPKKEIDRDSAPAGYYQEIKSFDDLVDYKNISLDSLKNIMAINEKPVFLFFSAFADLNSRKMEENLFQEDRETQRWRDQIIVLFMVDDRTPLPYNEKYFSTFTKDSVDNIGQRGMDLELRLNRYEQPCLLKVDDDLNILVIIYPQNNG